MEVFQTWIAFQILEGHESGAWGPVKGCRDITLELFCGLICTYNLQSSERILGLLLTICLMLFLPL